MRTRRTGVATGAVTGPEPRRRTCCTSALACGPARPGRPRLPAPPSQDGAARRPPFAAPRLELPDAAGKLVRLADLVGPRGGGRLLGELVRSLPAVLPRPRRAVPRAPRTRPGGARRDGGRDARGGRRLPRRAPAPDDGAVRPGGEGRGSVRRRGHADDVRGRPPREWSALVTRATRRRWRVRCAPTWSDCWPSVEAGAGLRLSRRTGSPAGAPSRCARAWPGGARASGAARPRGRRPCASGARRGSPRRGRAVRAARAARRGAR